MPAGTPGCRGASWDTGLSRRQLGHRVVVVPAGTPGCRGASWDTGLSRCQLGHRVVAVPAGTPGCHSASWDTGLSRCQLGHRVVAVPGAEPQRPRVSGAVGVQLRPSGRVRLRPAYLDAEAAEGRQERRGAHLQLLDAPSREAPGASSSSSSSSSSSFTARLADARSGVYFIVFVCCQNSYRPGNCVSSAVGPLFSVVTCYASMFPFHRPDPIGYNILLSFGRFYFKYNFSGRRCFMY